MTSSDLVSSGVLSSARQSGSLPLVAISGAHGKTTVAYLLSSILQHSGNTVANWITPGVHVNGERLESEISAWQRVVRAARVGEVDVLVQELQAQVSLAVGLPPRAYWMAIATNICGPDQVCARTSTAAREQKALERLLSESIVPGASVVVNADDRIVLQMVSDARATPVLFALHAGNPALRKHLASGGTAGWVDDEWVYLAYRGRIEPLVEVSRLQATLGGSLVPQLQNVLAAAAGARELGASLDAIRDGCTKFESNANTFPGIFNVNVLENGASMLVDTPRQLWSLRSTLRGLRQRSPRQILVVAGALSGLHDDEIFDAGRLLGSVASVVLIHSKQRSPERYEQLSRGLASSDAAPLILPQPDQETALGIVRSRLASDDMGVVLLDDH